MAAYVGAQQEKIESQGESAIFCRVTFVGYDLLLGLGNSLDGTVELVKPSITNTTLSRWNFACKAAKFLNLTGTFCLPLLFKMWVWRFKQMVHMKIETTRTRCHKKRFENFQPFFALKQK